MKSRRGDRWPSRSRWRCRRRWRGFSSRGTVAVDLVLVVVVYVALTFGPATGLLSGTLAGLVQDALSSGIIGIGGLAKTLVGFLAGIIGTQFIVTAPLPRFVVFFAATVAARGHVHGAVRAARTCGISARRMAAVAGQALGQRGGRRGRVPAGRAAARRGRAAPRRKVPAAALNDRRHRHNCHALKIAAMPPSA